MSGVIASTQAVVLLDLRELDASPDPQPALRSDHDPPGRRAQGRAALPPSVRARRDATAPRPRVPPPARDHRAPPTVAAPARACPLPDLRKRRDGRPHPDLFQRTPRLSGEAPAGGSASG